MFRFYPIFLMLGMTLATGTEVSAASAAPADPDYETVVSAPHRDVPVPTSPGDPAGFAASPLVITAKTIQPHLRLRFVMRDGTVLVGQVLAFDGQMYALRLPHSTLLVRKDFCKAIKPVATPGPRRPSVRLAAGPRA